jgi:hypothetical protein
MYTEVYFIYEIRCIRVVISTNIGGVLEIFHTGHPGNRPLRPAAAPHTEFEPADVAANSTRSGRTAAGTVRW